MSDIQPLDPITTTTTDMTSGRWSVREWLSERILFGLLILGGYIGLLVFVGMNKDLGATAGAAQLQTVRDGLLVLGPVVGMIAQAIWKTDKTDRQNADSLAKVVAANNSVPTPPPDSTKVTQTKTVSG